MGEYDYYCPRCDLGFTVRKQMADASRQEYCKCGNEARRKYTPLVATYGWRLTDDCLYGDAPDKMERNI